MGKNFLKEGDTPSTPYYNPLFKEGDTPSTPYYNPLITVSIIGLFAASGTVIALGLNVKDWRWLSAFSSVGCVLGASYLELGKPLINRLI